MSRMKLIFELFFYELVKELCTRSALKTKQQECIINYKLEYKKIYALILYYPSLMEYEVCLISFPNLKHIFKCCS